MLPDSGELDDRTLRDLSSRLRGALDFGRRVGEIRRSHGARDLWHEVYPDLSEGSEGLVGAVTGRAEAQVTRLSAMFAVLERSRLVEPVHLDAALHVWRYCDASARAVFTDATGNALADKVLGVLKAQSPMTRTDLRDAWGRHVSSADLESALHTLAANGLASMRKEETAGRPREIWVATP